MGVKSLRGFIHPSAATRPGAPLSQVGQTASNIKPDRRPATRGEIKLGCADKRSLYFSSLFSAIDGPSDVNLVADTEEENSPLAASTSRVDRMSQRLRRKE